MCVGLARATSTLFLSRAELLNALGQELIPRVLCLVLRQLGVTLDAQHERAGVYLTNALTGWEPHGNKPLAFPKFEEERGKAE